MRAPVQRRAARVRPAGAPPLESPELLLAELEAEVEPQLPLPPPLQSPHRSPLPQQQTGKKVGKHPAELPARSRRTKPSAFIGRRVEVLFDGTDWYAGTVHAFSAATNKHTVHYDNGDRDSHNLEEDEEDGLLRWLSS